MGRGKVSSREGERLKVLRTKNKKIQKSQQRPESKSFLKGLVKFLVSDSYMYGPLLANNCIEKVRAGESEEGSLPEGKSYVVPGLDVGEHVSIKETRSVLLVRRDG